MDLKDKTIVITGAAQGLGKKMAEVLARQGAKIALVDLDEAKIHETARLCTDAGSEAKSYPANVADEPAVETLFASVRKDFGSVDALINNAGTNRDALLVKVKDGKVQGKMSLADFNQVIAVDLVGVFLARYKIRVAGIAPGFCDTRADLRLNVGHHARCSISCRTTTTTAASLRSTGACVCDCWQVGIKGGIMAAREIALCTVIGTSD